MKRREFITVIGGAAHRPDVLLLSNDS